MSILFDKFVDVAILEIFGQLTIIDVVVVIDIHIVFGVAVICPKDVVIAHFDNCFFSSIGERYLPLIRLCSMAWQLGQTGIRSLTGFII